MNKFRHRRREDNTWILDRGGVAGLKFNEAVEAKASQAPKQAKPTAPWPWFAYKLCWKRHCAESTLKHVKE